MSAERVFTRLQNGSDVRGAAIGTEKEPRTLTPDLAQYIAYAFVQWLAEHTGKDPETLRVAVGHDSRVTADVIREACLKGMSSAQVFDCGLTSTPAMFQSTVLPATAFDGAAMITASHLPYNRNGIKFFTKEGGLEKADLTDVLRRAAALAQQYGEEDPEALVSASRLPVRQGNAAEKCSLSDLYAQHMREMICSGVAAEDYAHPLRGLKIVVDAGNGAAGFFATKILEPLGANIRGSQFLEPDGMFPNHVPNPENEEAMASVTAAVLDNHADLGVIFDCDGDRGAVVFADGTPVNRNTLIALLAAIIRDKAPGSTIVTDSITSDELHAFLEEDLGMKHLRFKRGYKNVINKGIELNAAGEDCELAIETSGHGAFKENYFSDDGAYIAVKIIIRMARMMREGKRIEDLIAGLRYPAESIERRFRIEEEDFAACGGEVLEAFEAFARQDARFHIVTPNYEGIRIAFDDEEVKGWLLLRRSLHDPVLPLNIEAEEKGGAQIILDRIAPFIEANKERIRL